MPFRPVPCLFMRGGSSRGPFFLADDLPDEVAARDRVLLSAMGSPDVRQIDGLGGADTLTSKVAIISKSNRPDVDVDYLFAQVKIDEAIVDTSPNCGNMLAGVGPFAIEQGLVGADGNETCVTIYNVNTSSRIEAVVQTPEGHVSYDGDASIHGVPGTSAPVLLNFMDIVGGKCGALLPTGAVVDQIAGFDVTCIDVAMPMVLMRATDFGITGHESRAELEAMPELVKAFDEVRLKAGAKMGLGDVRGLVIPKVGLLSSAREGGTVASRYFTPWALHAAHAVTGGICVASACALEGSIAHELAEPLPYTDGPQDVTIEHPSGVIDVRIHVAWSGSRMDVLSAGILRTSRLIMRGEVMVAA